MMTALFLSSSFTLAFIFMFMNHPLAMGLSLLVQTLLISISVGVPLTSFWFSYILFLVFLGGMLVLFIYVASLASNEMFSLSTSLMFTMLIVGSLSLIFLLFTGPANMNPLLNFISQSSLIENLDLYTTFIMKMYNILNYTLTLMMILYLLLALIIVANIVTIQEGPLRPLT